MSDDLYTEAAEDVYDAYFRVSDFAKVPCYPNAAAILRKRFVPRVAGPHDGLIERLETFGAWAEVADRHRLTKDAAAAIASLQAELAEAMEALRKEACVCEMSAGIMRDPRRTGGWQGAENTANAFDLITQQEAEIERLRDDLRMIAHNNWRDQTRAKFIARAALEQA